MNPVRRVAILFGGASVEHEVSVTSARSVVQAIRDTPLVPVPVGVTAEGRWLAPDRSGEILASSSARVEAAADDDGSRLAIVPGDPHPLWVAGDGGARPLPVDAVFPLIHGWGGEDGRLQGALELAGTPYVGSGVLGSAAAMDKGCTKKILAAHGVPGVKWLGFDRWTYRRDPAAAHLRMAGELGFPLFVKPANGGSSVGISRVDSTEGLAGAVDEALACDSQVVVEVGLDAREIECGVLGNDAPQASVLGEIVPSAAFYDYAAKYEADDSELIIPARLDDATRTTVRRLALEAFGALGLAGFARVDFLLDRGSGRVYLNEVNTLPGFTPISMFPKLWEASGLPYPALIERLVDLALERRGSEVRRRVLRTETGLD